MQRVLLASFLLCLVLAGCSDAPPSGEFTTDRNNLEGLMGNVQVTYEERVRPASDVPPVEDAVCLPSGVPVQEGQCREPFTNVTGAFTGLPDPGANDYTVQFTSSAAANESLPVGALVPNATANGTGAYDLPFVSFEENYEGAYDTAELRAGDVLVATAGLAEGDNTFTLDPALTSLSAAGAWKGKELTVTVSGAQPGVAYTGYLYEEDDAGVMTQAESFPIPGDGEHVHEATKDIDEFAEFHVHVAGTSLNVAQATIE